MKGVVGVGLYEAVKRWTPWTAPFQFVTYGSEVAAAVSIVSDVHLCFTSLGDTLEQLTHGATRAYTDVSLLKGRLDNYKRHQPTPAELKSSFDRIRASKDRLENILPGFESTP